jgi:hypothetical protein
MSTSGLTLGAAVGCRGLVLSLIMRVGHSTRRANQPLTMPGSTPSVLVWAAAVRFPALFLLTITGQAMADPVDPSLLDLEARVEYGYFTEDTRTLEGLAAPLAGDEATDGMRSYYAALAGYRLALVESEKDKTKARSAAEQCVGSLDRAQQATAAATPAESMALQGACLELLGQLSPLRAPLAGSKGKSQIQKALKLAPRNPRVLLLDAIVASGGAANGAERELTLGKLKKAIVALEGERQELVHAPAWGLADAYTRLGRLYLDKGEPVAARDALEHALLAAPEFQQARRLMTKITSG